MDLDSLDIETYLGGFFGRGKVGEPLHLEYSKGKKKKTSGLGSSLTLRAAQGELMSPKLKTHTLQNTRVGWAGGVPK